MHLSPNLKGYSNKFVPEYSRMIQKELNDSVHDFVYIGDDSTLKGFDYKRIFNDNVISAVMILFYMMRYDRIIIHTLPPKWSLIVLSFFIKHYSNVDFVLWGGEIHHREFEKRLIIGKLHDYFKKKFMKGIVNFITYIEADVEIVRTFNPAAKMINLGGFYPSNSVLVRENAFFNRKIKTDNNINILLGASALERNNHIYMIDMLSSYMSTYQEKKIKVFIPLSYGDDCYAQKIIEYACLKLGDDVVHPMLDFMAFDKYIEFLATIDVAVFAHDGQQGMGNIRNLMGSGAKVFLKKNSVTWNYLSNLYFNVFDVASLNLVIDDELMIKNVELSKTIFSHQATIQAQRSYFDL